MNFRICILLFLFTALACNKEAPAPPPAANFFVSNSGCTAPCEVFFFDDSENATKWRWDFDNGTASSLEDDTTTYVSPGTYEVWLKIWNADNVSDSIRKSVIIN